MTNCHRRGIGNIQDGLHRVFKDLKILENGHLFGIYGVEMTCYYYCLVKYTMKNSFFESFDNNPRWPSINRIFHDFSYYLLLSVRERK